MNKLLSHIAKGVVWLFAFGESLMKLLVELDPEKWDDLRKGMDYNEAPPPEMQTPTETIAPFGLGIWAEMAKIFLIIFLVGLLIFLIVKLILKSKGSAKPREKNTDIKSPNQVMPTALSPMETLWAHFQNAKDAGDYRECLRILYQISLKKLGQNGWVITKTDKTNREYLKEIRKGVVANSFNNLTLIHEYSWYGNTLLEQSEYKRFEPQFLDFINSPAIEKK